MPLFSIQLCINKIASNKIICQDKLKREIEESSQKLLSAL
jgi:hypothetical protein